MDSRAETYMNLRVRVLELAKLNRGEPISTNELMASLDRIWRAMIKARAVTIKAIRGAENLSQDEWSPPSSDFYCLFVRLHSLPEGAETVICDACLSAAEREKPSCPFCGELMGPADSVAPDSAVIDFDIPDNMPNWDIPTDPKEMIARDENLPLLKPITARDDIGGPKGRGPSRKRRPDHLSRAAQEMVIWARKREFGQMIPFASADLSKYSVQDLKAIAAMMPEYDHDRVVAMPTNDLIKYILGRQGSGPIDPGPPPHGKLPEDLREGAEDGAN